VEIVLISPSVDGDLVRLSGLYISFNYGDLILVPSSKGVEEDNVMGIFLSHYPFATPGLDHYFYRFDMQDFNKKSMCVSSLLWNVNKTKRLCLEHDYSIQKLSPDESIIYSKGETVGVKTRKVVRHYDRKVLSYEVLIGNKKIWKHDY